MGTLLRLLREVRDITYAYTMVLPHEITFCERKSDGAICYDNTLFPDRKNIFNLPRTCKVVNEEATPLFYGNNEFIFTIHPLERRSVRISDGTGWIVSETQRSMSHHSWSNFPTS
jgi:hypothetical protein